MKNFKPLSKAEMKKVLGGNDIICPPGYCYNEATQYCVICDGGGDITCQIVIKEGCFGHGGPGPSWTGPSKAAAEAYCSNDPCCASITCP